jgi:GNAT superfamily N-acetyltransferase
MECLTRRANRDEVDSLAILLADSFHDDPLWRWMLPGDVHRKDKLRRYFELELTNVSFPFGRVDVSRSGEGMAVWLPRGGLALSVLDGINLRATTQAIFRDLTRFDTFTEIEPTVAGDWELMLIAVRSSARRTGLGSAVVRPVLQLCDAKRLTATAQSTSEPAAAFLSYLGFRSAGTSALTGGPPIFHHFRAPARAPATHA